MEKTLPREKVFVFGSNTEGRHGKGAALHARKHFGAIYGIPEGRQGQSYAIVTKDLSKGLRSVSLDSIKRQIDRFIEYARIHENVDFVVSAFGCGLAGFKYDEIAGLFANTDIPSNVQLPDEFTNAMDCAKCENTENTENTAEVVKSEDFVHLHVHSQYSLLDGVPSPDAIAQYAKELGQPGIAITDHGYMFASYKHQNACNEVGIKAIHGCEFYYVDDMYSKESRNNYHLLLLVMNQDGWKNIVYLNSIAGSEGFYYRPRIDPSVLKDHNDGLICLTACYKSPVSYHFGIEERNVDKARENFLLLQSIFGDRFYNEVMHINWSDYDDLVPELAQLANDHNVKTVATNDSHYLKKEDAEIQAIMLAIATGGSGSGLEFSSNDLYLKNREQMITGHILPEWVDTTMEIFDRVDFELSFSGYQFPSFDIESTDEYNNFEEYMKRKGVI